MRSQQRIPVSFIHLMLSYICSTMGATDSTEYIFRRDDIKITTGVDECISPCSKNDVNGNHCLFEKCNFSRMTDSMQAQAHNIDIEDAYFEKYTDEVARENKLALVVKWSDDKNAMPVKPNRYLINITDGVTSYILCYNASAFMDELKGLFYNDCFGKADRTLVRPGSMITVRIGSSPFKEKDGGFEGVTAKIEVPDCTNADLHSLKTCRTSGGIPTSQSCMIDCSTYSVMNNITYPVSCTISKGDSKDQIGLEKCDNVNKTTTGTPSMPKHILQEQEWYKFLDENNNVKIALNFSWIPGLDSSISDLRGYFFEITPESINDVTNFNKCYTVHTVLSEHKHKNAVFYYDCYGRVSGTSVTPGQSYRVRIQSLPSSGEALTFSIHIPTCANPSTQDVTYCIKENNRIIEGEVEEIFCENRSVKYSYHVSPEYGSRAEVLFCERGIGVIHCKLPLLIFWDLLPFGTLYNITLSSSANLSINYSIIVNGNDYPEYGNVDYPDFSHCVTSEEGLSNAVLISIIFVMIAIIVALLVLFTYCYKRKKKQQIPECSVNMSKHRLPLVDNSPVIPVDTRVYVIFADDHKLHKEVIHWFCTFLKTDLGLDVRLSIWEESAVFKNPIQYMMTNLKNADKVVIICSEGTKQCLEEPDNNRSLGAPIIREICMLALHAENPTKFLIGYFDYCKEEHVPEPLLGHCQMYSSIFKLMKQFEDFYFRLIAIEQYREGGVLRIDKIAPDKYHDPRLTKSGGKLKESIEKMSAFVQQNPTWYTDHHGDEVAELNFPSEPAAVQRPGEGQSTTERIEQQPDFTQIHTLSPPEITNNNDRGARPKTSKVTLVERENSHLPPQANHTPMPPMDRESQEHSCTIIQNAKIPRPVVHKEPCEHGDSVVNESTDSSYMVPEFQSQDQNETSDLDILVPQRPVVIHYPGALQNSVPHRVSYKPDYFLTNDFANSNIPNGHLPSYLPSNATEMSDPDDTDLSTTLEPDSSYSTTDTLQNSTQPPSPKIEPISSVNADEDDLDIEEQIKSINLSDFPE